MGDLLAEREQVLQDMFCSYDVAMKGGLHSEQLQLLHSQLRIGGISIPQVKASIQYVCVGDTCDLSELLDVLKEMDRRYFLIQDLCWEFTMLDRDQTDTISEESAKWLVQMVYGKFFSQRKWEQFLQQRAAPGSGISFPEIEVLLCNIPNVHDLMEEELDKQRLQREHEKEQRENERRLQQEKKEREKARRTSDAAELHAREDEERRLQEEEEEKTQRRRENEEAERRERELGEEERDRAEAAAREAEMAEAREAERKRQEELEKRRRELADGDEYNRIYEEEKRKEKEADLEAIRQKTKFQHVKEAALKKEAEAAERRARMKAREHCNMKIRYNLKYSIKKQDRVRLPVAVNDFVTAKLPDDDQDLPKAERIMNLFKASDGLKKAMQMRKLPELEKAINFVKHNGFEPQLHNEMREAHLMLLQLRRLERIRAEILELKQSTVAEIRSYSKPPPVVHVVMTATFLLLGHKEKETKVWKHVQALVGKTGKEGLKRCCLQAEPSKINPTAAQRAGTLLSQLDLEEVRDVSAGAATFFVWSTTMIEENELHIQSIALEEEEKKMEAEEKKRLAAEEKERKKIEAAEEEEHKKAIEEAKLEALAGNADVTPSAE